MKLKNLLILLSLCLLPTACADGQVDAEIPPVTEAQPPVPQPVPENPVVPEETDDNEGEGPHYAPAGEVEYKPVPSLQPTQDPTQINPCLLHPEDC